MESSEWPEVGILSGNIVNMGDYAECLKSEAPRFRGKYCLMVAALQLRSKSIPSVAGNRRNSKWTGRPDENASAWDVINKVNELRGLISTTYSYYGLLMFDSA